MSGNSAQLNLRTPPLATAPCSKGAHLMPQNKDKQKDYSEIMMNPLGSSYKIMVIATGDVMERKGTEEALEKSLTTSEQALRELPDQKFALEQHAIVAVTDVHGTITYVNEKFWAISLYSEDELIGPNHRILNSGHHPKEFFQPMYHTIANGEVWHGEICNRAKSDGFYWLGTTFFPFLDAYGKFRQYMAIRADITERKTTEEIRERLATIIECSDDALISKDLNGIITAWNRGAEKTFGYSSTEVLGEPRLILFPPDRRGGPDNLTDRRQLWRTRKRARRIQTFPLCAKSRAGDARGVGRGV
jgi:PAS domain S-box-containing protein